MANSLNLLNRKTLAACCAWVACLGLAQAAPQAVPDPQALTELDWQLQSVKGKDGAWFARALSGLKMPVQLRFDADSVSVSGLCNQLGGRYLVSGARMLIEPLFGTKMACADAQLMALENRVERALPDVQGWQLQSATPSARASRQASTTLRLRFVNGSEWLLQGMPAAVVGGRAKPESQPPIFLEVAPQAQPCGPQGGQCLLVRQTYFDADGVRQTRRDGPWQPLAQPIEGFSFEPGALVVLRVHRRPDGAGYVLDERISYEAQ